MLTDLYRLKQWANPKLDSSRDEELDRCIQAASAWVKRMARWNIEQDTATEYLSGYDAVGRGNDTLLLPVRYRPVIHSGGTLVTVTESGTALTVAAAYDGSSDVMLVGANEERRCELVKPWGSWLGDYANVAVTLTYGYDADNDEIPLDIEQLANEVALMMFRSPEWIGKASKAARGGSTTYQKDLSATSQMTLERLIEQAT